MSLHRLLFSLIKRYDHTYGVSIFAGAIALPLAARTKKTDRDAYCRILQKEVPVDGVLALHRSVGVRKDDLGGKQACSMFLPGFPSSPCYPLTDRTG